MHTPLPNPDIASDNILKFDFFAVEPIDDDIHLVVCVKQIASYSVWPWHA